MQLLFRGWCLPRGYDVTHFLRHSLCTFLLS
uniref:Uncharacterized protein n=1 Tax=Anguilla anguilla TaxID=7936 RepID=A0A0E9PYH9_ANGAN